MDVNGHERLLNITLRHKCKEMNIAFITVLYFTVTVESSTMSNTDTANNLQLNGTLYFCR